MENCWDEENRIYTCGDNTVSVKGDVAVDFRFGAEGAVTGAFDSSLEKVFVEKDQGFIA